MRLPVSIVAASLTIATLGFVLADTPVPPPGFTPYPAPDLVVNLPEGKTLHLNSLKGKVVVVECLFTTCPHCQDTSRIFTNLQKEFGARGFQPVGVAFNDDVFAANTTPATVVGDFVKVFNVGYPVGWTDRSKILEFLGIGAFDRLSVPQMIWIDRKGMVRAKTQPAGVTDGEARKEPYFRQMIETLTKETAVPPKKAATHRPVHTAQK